jgi:HAD superfamily hydrolase (TIGR01509 family)
MSGRDQEEDHHDPWRTWPAARPPAAGRGVTGPAVFFDLDGTLVDTAYLHAFAWWRALDEAGERHAMAEIHPLIGMGGAGILETLLGRDDQAVSAAHGERFQELHPYVRPLPGAAGVLRRVAGGGGRVVVVTSAKEKDLGPLLDALNCDDVIHDLVHGEEVEHAKPAPDPFLVAMERTGARPDRSLAVGDSVWDVRAAAGVGMPCVAVQTGGIGPGDLARAGAAAVYRDLVELLDRWSSSPLGALLATPRG